MMKSEIPELHEETAQPSVSEEHSSGINAVDFLEEAGEDKPPLLHPDEDDKDFIHWPILCGHNNDLSSENSMELTHLSEESTVCQPEAGTSFLLTLSGSGIPSREGVSKIVPVLDLPKPSHNPCLGWPTLCPVPVVQNKSSVPSKPTPNLNLAPDVLEQFKCDRCDKGFSCKDFLESHRNLHSLDVSSDEGSTPTPEHVCSTCGNTFSSYSGLGRHFKSKHSGVNATQLFKKCDRCGKIFISNSLLQSHICSESLEHESDGKVSFQPSETEKEQAQGSKIDTEDLRRAETLKTSFTLSRNDLDEEDDLKVVETLDFQSSEFSGTSQAANGAIRGKAGLVNPKVEIRESSSVPERNMASLLKEFIHTEDKPHSCHLCGNSFTRAWVLSRHVRTVHEGKKSFLCDVCGKGFGHSGHLTNHKRLHTKEKPFKCTHCNKRFRQSGSCKNQERTHTGDRPYQCQFCEKRFRVSSDCGGHEPALHTKQNLHDCPTCYKRFLRPSWLQMHQKSCRAAKRNPCIEDLRQAETQNTSFTLSQSDLDEEEEDLKVVEILDSQTSEFSGTSHTASASISDNAGLAIADPKAETQESSILNKSMDQLFKCDMTFNSQLVLEQHRPRLHGFKHGSDGARSSPTRTVERHTQEEMADAEQIRHVKTVSNTAISVIHKCHNCEKTFASRSGLLSHSRIHTCEKSFQCKYCDRKFPDFSAKKMHRETVHKNEKPYKCQFCDKKFASPYARGLHGTIHTQDKRHKCRFCDQKFAHPKILGKHEQSVHIQKPHSFACSFCDKGFRQLRLMKIHLETSHGQDMQMKSHKCQFCDKKFFKKASCQGHERSIHTGERPFECRFCAKTFATNDNCQNHEKGVHLSQGEYGITSEVASSSNVTKSDLEKCREIDHDAKPI